jgi:poly-gamma-glutamate capsule biosynthesis protein CapA/YwtB (metallophosphatase superfamily)
LSQITLLLCGDVMLGRGIDQVLPYPAAPTLHEPYINDAMEYVELAEEMSGPIPRPVSFKYVWGDALYELERMMPDVSIVNLETSITTSAAYWKTKDVHYKMNPPNVSCITAAKIDCCALANNHILDWGYQGLAETLDTLKQAKVKSTGAGMNLEEAESPVVMEVTGKGRVIIFSLGLTTSGIPVGWAALKNRPGVNLIKDFSDETVRHIGEKTRQVKCEGDMVIASIHWGANWGYQITSEQIEFAHRLIDRAGFDVIHGHSSHHVKGIEVYRDKPILYGCGDFLNDYEGITDYEAFRGDLGLMYFLTVDMSSGMLFNMLMTPTQIKHFRVNLASPEDAIWLEDTLNREGRQFGTGIEKREDGILMLLGMVPPFTDIHQGPE